MNFGPNVRMPLSESKEIYCEPKRLKIDNGNDLQMLAGPSTRSQAKKLREALIGLIQTIHTESEQSTFHFELSVEQQPCNVLNAAQ
ncbi:hypothetical protein GOBAR_DD05853 [Gossypium barbadense]|nr:hypothetical protein GOBAR_DD05853 [Gossypium barbadense]